jgi:hypothetical protein
MNKGGLKMDWMDWFTLIAGAASIISLVIAILVKTEVKKIRVNIEQNNSKKLDKPTTSGEASPIITDVQKDVNYKYSRK